MCLKQLQMPMSKNVLPGNVSEASIQKRGWESSQLRFLTITPKRYKTKHVFIISTKNVYICNVSELRGKGMRKKRRARYRFRATLKFHYPLRPRLPLRQNQKTRSLPTFLSYSALIFSSSSSSVRRPDNRCNRKRHSRNGESMLLWGLFSERRLRKFPNRYA